MVVILSDIHGNIEALTAVISDVIRIDIVTKWIVLGDMVDYGADSLEVLRSIDNLPCRHVLKGNHEDAIIRNDCSRFSSDHGRESFKITYDEYERSDEFRKLISTLCSDPSTKIINPRVTITHGTLEDELWGKHGRLLTTSSYSAPADSRIVLSGHSHLQGVRCEESGTIINPGSVGQPRNGDHRAQYAICNDDYREFEFRRVDYDVETAANKIVESGRPKFLATRLYLGI